MVERVKLRTLLIDGNDMSGAIPVAFASMPREEQAALLATLLAQAPPRLRWLGTATSSPRTVVPYQPRS